jgi:hypothetical protein
MTAVRHAAASAMEPPAAAATASRRMARCAARTTRKQHGDYGLELEAERSHRGAVLTG